MDKERKELLDKIEKKVIPFVKDYLEEHNFKNYDVKDVFCYKKEIELVSKETKQIEKFKLYAVQTESLNPEEGIDPRFELECLEDENGELFTIEDLREKYEEESFKDIGQVVQDTEHNEELLEEEQDEELKKDTLEELRKERELEDKEKNREKKKGSKEELITDKKISNPKGEVDLDQQVNGETLRKILDLGEEYDSIAPVRAASIGVPSTSEYIFVGVKNDKTCTVLGEDKIQEDRQKGENPDEKDLKVNNDGKLTEESSLANFRIVNRPNFVMSVRFDKGTSTRETTISDISGRESRDEEVAQELHKDGDEIIDDDARDLLREENGIGASDDMSKKQEEHEDVGCENEEVENIDDDKDNDTHVHYVITRDSKVPGKDGMTVEQWADELGENPDVIVDRLQREVDKDDGYTLDEKVEEIESDYEMAGHEHKQ